MLKRLVHTFRLPIGLGVKRCREPETGARKVE